MTGLDVMPPTTEASAASTIPAQHRGDEQVDLAVLGGGRTQQFGGGGLDGGCVDQIQSHQPALGLVGDAVATQLRHDRETELLGCGHGGPAGVDDPLLSDRNAERDQQTLRLGFTQGRHGERSYAVHPAQGVRAARKNSRR